MLLVVTQIFTRFVVDPLVDFRRLLGEVAYTLILHANRLFNPSVTADQPEFQQAKNDCRKLASRLHAFSARLCLSTIFWLSSGLFLRSAVFMKQQGI